MHGEHRTGPVAAIVEGRPVQHVARYNHTGRRNGTVVAAGKTKKVGEGLRRGRPRQQPTQSRQRENEVQLFDVSFEIGFNAVRLAFDCLILSITNLVFCQCFTAWNRGRRGVV